jgi:putative ABC transport system permease protein
MRDHVWNDVRFSLRLLGRDRAFTLIAIAALGAGIGVANMNFVVVNAFCLRGLPIDGVDRVMFIGARDRQNRDVPNSDLERVALESESSTFGTPAAYANASFIVTEEGLSPDRMAGTYVSAAMFRVLAERPAVGRDFQPSDDRDGAAPVAILSDRFWRSRYDADRAVLGRTVRINGLPATVIGVMAPGFRFPANTDVWQPLAAMPRRGPDPATARRLSIVARLPNGVTFASARGRLDAVRSRLSREYPESNRDIRLTAAPINERFNARMTEPTWLAFIGVGAVVLLIACANVANLLLMRSMQRSHEMAVRMSLGASRARLIQQLVVENAVLAILGAVAGTALSLTGVRLITSIIPENTLGYFIRFSMDGRVLVVLLGVVIVTVLAFGIAPGMHVSKTTLSTLARDGSRSSAGSRKRRLTTVFLTAEFALTMVLLATLALGLRVARAIDSNATSVAVANVSTAAISLPSSKYASDAERLALYDDMERRLSASPGIAAVAVSTALPLGGGESRPLVVEERNRADGSSDATALTVAVGPRYFDALGISLRRGRAFTDRDGEPGREAVILNLRLADHMFPNGDAVGRRVGIVDSAGAKPVWLTIVGVAPTVRQRTAAEPDAVMYLPVRRAAPASATIIVRAQAPGLDASGLLRGITFAIDPELPLYRLRSLDQALRDAQWNARIARMLLDIMTYVAILLAATGLFGVTTHAVLQRQHEIGIRMALGARGSTIAAMVARRAAFHLLLGLVVGIAIVWAFERGAGLGGDAFGFRLSDPMTLFGAALLLTAITAIASAAPVWRASRLQPLQVLRMEGPGAA